MRQWQTPVARWGVGYGTAGAASCCQCRDVAFARPARASRRWRSMARQTVEPPTKSSATSRVLHSLLCTSETRCASWRLLSLGRLPRADPWPWRPSCPRGYEAGSGRTRLCGQSRPVKPHAVTDGTTRRLTAPLADQGSLVECGIPGCGSRDWDQAAQAPIGSSGPCRRWRAYVSLTR